MKREWVQKLGTQSKITSPFLGVQHMGGWPVDVWGKGLYTLSFISDTFAGTDNANCDNPLLCTATSTSSPLGNRK